MTIDYLNAALEKGEFIRAINTVARARSKPALGSDPTLRAVIDLLAELGLKLKIEPVS